MGQDWLKIDFGTGKVTFLDAMRKEDMLQVEYPNRLLLDMGWYQDRYIISIIQDFDWTHPIKQYKTTEGNQLSTLLAEAVRLVENPYDIESQSRNADFISIAHRAIHHPRPEGPSPPERSEHNPPPTGGHNLRPGGPSTFPFTTLLYNLRRSRHHNPRGQRPRQT